MLAPSNAIKYVAASWTFFYVLCVLFGAPFFSDIFATAVLSTFLTLVSAFPAVILFESEERALELAVFSTDTQTTSSELVLLTTSGFALFGAWAAAAVHPLDWDRWWQRYPLPSLFGCLSGALLGFAIGFIKVFWNKRNCSKKPKRK